MTPLARCCSGHGELCQPRHPGAGPRSQDHGEDDIVPDAGAVDRLGHGKAIRVVGHSDLAPQRASQVVCYGSSVEPSRTCAFRLSRTGVQRPGNSDSDAPVDPARGDRSACTPARSRSHRESGAHSVVLAVAPDDEYAWSYRQRGLDRKVGPLRFVEDSHISPIRDRSYNMRGAIIYGAGDVRCEERPDPLIIEPTDAIVRAAATCVCGSDLWRYRGIDEVTQPRAIGHEYCGVVERVGDDVSSVKPGQFVIGGFLTSDNTCPNCRAGMQSSCLRGGGYDGCQSELIRIPLADGTLVATPEEPAKEIVPSLLALSDVMATGWHAAVSGDAGPGMTVAVVGDGAVGLCAVLAASELGAERVIAMSRHESRQQLARQFGATDIVTERGEEGVGRIKEMTEGVGADAVLECVGSGESMLQALRSARPGGMVGWVGAPHGVDVSMADTFWRNVGVRGGPAPVRHYLPDLLDRVWNRRIDPGKVFDMELPLEQVGDAYRAMDERRAIKVLLSV